MHSKIPMIAENVISMKLRETLKSSIWSTAESVICGICIAEHVAATHIAFGRGS